MRYFKARPRDFDSPWPFPEHTDDDRKMRHYMTTMQRTNANPAVIRKEAAEQLGVRLD